MPRLFKIISLFVTAALLITSFNWEVNYHLCCGNIIEVGVFSTPESCDMATDNSCNENGGKSEVDVNCCKDVTVLVPSLDNLRKFEKSTSIDLHFVKTEINRALPPFNGFLTTAISYHNLAPPWKSIDLLNLFQIYLI